jgi:hypothetical protein
MIPTYVTPVLVTGTVTSVPSGTQNVNVTGPNPLPVTGTIAPAPAFNATTTPITVTPVAISIAGINAVRKNLLIQTNDPILIRLDGVVTLGTYSVEMPKKALYEIANYCGPVTAIKVTAGSTIVTITEVF